MPQLGPKQIEAIKSFGLGAAAGEKHADKKADEPKAAVNFQQVSEAEKTK